MSIQNVVEDLTQICIELRSVVESTEDESEKERIVLKHIKAYAESGLRINDFAKGKTNNVLVYFYFFEFLLITLFI
jgi:hypothetical protein